MRIGAQTSSLKSDDAEGDIAVIKEFFELDAIETYGSIPPYAKRCTIWRQREKIIRKRVPVIWKDILR